MSGSRGGSFKSYLQENVPSLPRIKQRVPSLKSSKLPLDDHLQIPETDSEPVPFPELLNGELIIRQAPNVLRFDTFSGQSSGISGSLTCTNFKISFVAANKPAAKMVGLDQRNLLYKDNDIPLTFVKTIYQVGERGKKQLVRGSKSISSSSEVLEIRTKNCKVFTFSFKFTRVSDMRSMIQTILHHAYPTKIQLLFAFSFKHELSVPAENGIDHHHPQNLKNDSNVPSIRFNDVDKASAPPKPPPKPGKGKVDWTTGKTPTFRDIKDWQDEISRWGKQSLRITSVNVEFMLCDSLPEYFVVPMGLYDSDIQGMAPHFIDSRVPFWCWSSSAGSSLFRMSHPNSDMDSEGSMKRVMRSIADIRPSTDESSLKELPMVVDLDKKFPSVKEVQSSFQKIQDLCTVVSMKEFSANEQKWFSLLEGSKWLQYVSVCLERAKCAATQLDGNKSVVIIESSGRDLSCLVSSLTQIMLDPHYRTQLGFQSLVQREWVAAGHDFLARSGHCYSQSTEEVSPVFVLFLDCVFQLMRQYPMAFEFNDTFLIVIWDSLLTCLFDTFLFSSEQHRRAMLELTGPKSLISVWAWTLQFSSFDQNLFSNPLYLIRDDLDMYRHKLDIPPLIDETESCNSGVYRIVAKVAKNGSTMVQSSDGAGAMNGGGSRLSAYSAASSTDSEVRNVEAINRVLEPQYGAPCIQFWVHCYLRWVPSAHILGGGEVGIFHQYCCLIGEIQELFKRLEGLSAEEHPPLKTRCHSEKLFLTSFEDLTSNQECLTSAFPFTTSDLEFLGADRQSFVSTSLVKFLQGQSLLDTDVDDQSAEASSDEMDL